MTLSELASRWRTDADVLARNGAEPLALICRRHADDLDAAVRDADAEPLTLEQAAQESGYSADRLRHMVADGSVPNAGRKGAPRVRRGDLPHKPAWPARRLRALPSHTFDAEQVAREIVGTMRRA